MTQLLVIEPVEVPVSRCPVRPITDTELAAMRPSPRRRPPELIARRAAKLGLVPHRAPRRGYRIWPLLITFGVAAAYLYVGLVVL